MIKWISKSRFLVILSLASLFSQSISADDAPKKPLFLVCGSHLVAISTTLKQKLVNAVDAQSRAVVSFDARTLWKDKKIGGPINMQDVGWASREVIQLTGGFSYQYSLNRVTGQLSWHEKRQRPKKSHLNRCPNTKEPHKRILFGCDEHYWALRDKYECTEETENRLNEIIENHNRDVEDSQPERKF